MSWEGEQVYVIAAINDLTEWLLCPATNLEAHLAAHPSEDPPLIPLASFKASSWEAATKYFSAFRDQERDGLYTRNVSAIAEELFTRHAAAFQRLAE